jgi:hypothetical protein
MHHHDVADKPNRLLLQKEMYLSLRLLFLFGFGVLACDFSSEGLRAEQSPVPSAATVAQATSVISPTPSPTVPPSVRAVGVHNWKGEQRHLYETYAQRGDTIWVDIVNFDEWVNSLEKKPENHDLKDLILYLDHFPLSGISPIYSYRWIPDQWTAKGKD